MSRIGKMPVEIPDGVTVNVADREVQVKGPKGALVQGLPPGIDAEVEDSTLKVSRSDETRQSRAFHGLARALLANLVTGVISMSTREPTD